MKYMHLLIWGLQITSLLELALCKRGFKYVRGKDEDENECNVDKQICGDNASCFNTYGSYYCRCIDGFQTSYTTETGNFTQDTGITCQEMSECQRAPSICGPNAECVPSGNSYHCTCKTGFVATNGKEMFKVDKGVSCIDRDVCREIECGHHAKCRNAFANYSCVCDVGFGLKSGNAYFTDDDKDKDCVDICKIDTSICGNGGDCQSGDDGIKCVCHPGYTSYGNNCTVMKCDEFFSVMNAYQTWPVAEQILTILGNSCSELTGIASARAGVRKPSLDGDALLQKLLSMIDGLLSSGPLNDNKKVTALLTPVEAALKLIGALLKNNDTRRRSEKAEVMLLVKRQPSAPQGPVILSSNHCHLETHWETAAGDIHPGFTTASLLTYQSLENSTNKYFYGVEPSEGETLHINSKVVTVTVSNLNTTHLRKPIKLTFTHLKRKNANHTCVFWDPNLKGGAWSTDGCTRVASTATDTVCSCSHLSSFAVLMALYDIDDPFQLQLITWVGLSLSLVCFLICIITFSCIRSIQSTRNTIHLHLCISLCIADLIFLIGISHTENQVGCAFVAGLLHFFFLAAFCWMCLEGVQLFRMVVLVFNTTLRPLYLMAAGYGTPAVIVIISAIANVEGYGTKKHCWLNLKDNFIWSFFGPVCIIIVVNVFFFLITVWKLAQKFSSLNPDLDNLHKIKTFTITAIAQLCVLGTMWIFGCFQFDRNTLVMSYLFTIFNSLQGVLVFIMHCLLTKQVREEYGKVLSSIWGPQKKKYSESLSNQSSKSQTSRSVQHTGESQI